MGDTVVVLEGGQLFATLYLTHAVGHGTADLEREVGGFRFWEARAFPFDDIVEQIAAVDELEHEANLLGIRVRVEQTTNVLLNFG